MNTSKSCFILVGPEDKARVMAIEAGLAPRIDYHLVAEILDAAVIECAPPPTAFKGHGIVRRLGSLLGNFRAAWLLMQQVPDDSIIYSTGETWGVPVAVVGAFIHRRNVRHVIYVHRVFSATWQRFLGTTGHWLAVDGWICSTQQQAQILRAALGATGAPIAVVSQGVDTRFYDLSKAAVPQSPCYLLSVGIEMRDYDLLFDAVRSLDIDVVLKASSAWMVGGRSQLASIPPNVRVITERLSYVDLRDLYARAALVVVPLHETPQAAGITTILEAMAMNRPVVATRSAGLPDILVNGQTGVVAEHATDALAHSIVEMLARPDLRETLASNARQTVTLTMTIEAHARQIGHFLASVGKMQDGICWKQ